MLGELKKYFTSNDPHHDIYTFSYWQIFWHSIWHIFWHSIWHSIWHIFWHMFWHIFWFYLANLLHSIWQSDSIDILSGISSDIHLTRSVLRSGSRGWGSAAIWKSRLRSGSVGSGARGWGPTVWSKCPMLTWKSLEKQLAVEVRAHWDLEQVRLCPIWTARDGGWGRRTALIKSDYPHLAGGEQQMNNGSRNYDYQFDHHQALNSIWKL